MVLISYSVTAMIFRNHNACRPGVKALLDPDNIVRNDYYLYKKSGEVLEFPVVYAPRKDEELNSVEFAKRIESDLRFDEILVGPYKLELVTMEDMGNLSQKLTFKVVDPYFFEIKLRKDKAVKDRIYGTLNLIKSVVLDGDAMIDPQRGNRIVVEGDSSLVTAVERFEMGSVSAYSENVRKSAEKFVAKWVESENVIMEGWEYVVEVDSEKHDTMCVMRVFARAC